MLSYDLRIIELCNYIYFLEKSKQYQQLKPILAKKKHEVYAKINT